MKVGYEALNAEMCHDIPQFINDKDAFFQPLFARFIMANHQFHQRAYELYAELLPHFQHIDRLAIHEHQPGTPVLCCVVLCCVCCACLRVLILNRPVLTAC